MSKFDYNIKITGNGTKKEIAKELRELADSVEQAKGDAELDGAEWEGDTLMTEISAC